VICWGNLSERCHYEDLDVDGRIILKWAFEEYDGRVWIELVLPKIGTSGGIL
jgi:hypothetical protein